MEPQSDGRRVRSDNVLRWWNSLDGGPRRPGHAARSLPLALVLAAAGVIASMPLAWHHVVVPAHIYYGPPTVEVVNGLSAASWLLVVGGAAIVLVVRTLIARPALAATWWVTVVAATLHVLRLLRLEHTRRLDRCASLLRPRVLRLPGRRRVSCRRRRARLARTRGAVNASNVHGVGAGCSRNEPKPLG